MSGLGDLLKSAWDKAASLFSDKAPASPATACAGRGSIVLEGSDEEKKQLGQTLDKIAAGGPKGKAFVKALESAPTPTHVRIATSAEKKDGTVVPLSATGGGITLRPTESKSGHNEVYVDPSNLIDYQATDGSTVKEKPEGLLLHELGHAKLLNDGEVSQVKGGPAAEAAVRKETNDIRQELGMKPEQ
jgi:hypothetical protein